MLSWEFQKMPRSPGSQWISSHPLSRCWHAQTSWTVIRNWGVRRGRREELRAWAIPKQKQIHTILVFGTTHWKGKRKKTSEYVMIPGKPATSLTSFLISALSLLGTRVAESPEKHLPSPLTAHAEDSESSCWCVWSSLRTEGLYWFAWTKLPSRKDTV